MASTIPAIRAGLVTLLNNAGLTVPVTRTGTLDDDPYDPGVVVLNATEIERQYGLGDRSLREEFVIPVQVTVSAATTDIETLETSMWTVMTGVETAILGWARPDGTVHVQPSGIPDGVFTGPVDTNGRHMARAVVRVECIGCTQLP